MRIWDAELLTAKSGLSPVTDGLLFWLDGRDDLIGVEEYGSYTPPAWATSYMFDRVNNARIDFSRLQSSGGMQKDITGLYIYLFAPSGNGNQKAVITEISGVKTIEVMFGRAKTGYNLCGGKVDASSRVFFPFYSSSTGAKLDTGVPIYNAPVHLVFTGNSTNGKPVIYQNGVVASVTGSAAVAVQSFSVTSLFELAFGTSIGSIRLYNRTLTADEVQQNIAYEESIGRTIT